MIIERTTDLAKIIKVLKNPEIFERISEDGVSIDNWLPSLDDAIFLTDKENIGLMIYHEINSITIECHVQVLPEHRGKALEFGKSAIDWAWENTKATKIVAQIPEIYPDVIRFAYKNGFSFEGINKDSYLKNGKVHSQYYLGLIKPREVK
jgi:RimJ/RimL family protein N-acetyltransferase